MSALSKVFVAAAAALAFAGAASAASAADNSGAPTRSCFFTSQWRGWSAPAPGVIYLNVGPRKIYRVDVAGNARWLKSPGNFLVSELRGSTSVCSHLDLDLAVADQHGLYMPLIAQKLTLLTPEQVAAIPRKDLP